VTDDDANDGPGECPEHVFDLVDVQFLKEGGAMTYECRSCGALKYMAPGWTTRREIPPEQV
jgi:hypothetical protein